MENKKKIVIFSGAGVREIVDKIMSKEETNV